MTSPVEAPAATGQATPLSSPWMTLPEAASRARRHKQTVMLACQAYISGDRTKKALKCTQAGHKCRYSLLAADVDRWVQGLPPARATRVA